MSVIAVSSALGPFCNDTKVGTPGCRFRKCQQEVVVVTMEKTSAEEVGSAGQCHQSNLSQVTKKNKFGVQMTTTVSWAISPV